MAESFVDTFKTELIKDRVWETRSQMELAVLEWVAWFNAVRLHESLSDRPPVEVEAQWSTENGMVDEADCARTAPTGEVDEQLAAGLSEAK